MTDFLCVGVDGCKHGWAAVYATGTSPCELMLFKDFGEMLCQFASANVIAVDIPIGLPTPDHFPRDADKAAKAFLGSRQSCVFFSMPKEVLAQPDYPSAIRKSTEIGNPQKPSAQGYAIGKKILEVDRFVVQSHNVFEIHPEVTFCLINGGRPLEFSKHTKEGLDTRRRLLREAAIELPLIPFRKKAVKEDDVLDAMAALWSARRIARGEALTLPPQPPLDARGRKVAIWY